MKKVLKYIILFVFSLITANQIWHNLFFEKTPLTIIKVAVILSILELQLKTFVKNLFNTITFI